MGTDKKARFAEGESVDVPKYLEEHGNPEAAAKWTEMNEKYGDKLKKQAEDTQGILLSIHSGDKVTITDRFGKEHTGKAVMRGPHGWVLNMGGPHGTPGIATNENTVRVKKAAEDSLGALTKLAKEFATKEEYYKYMHDHPAADRRKHSIKPAEHRPSSSDDSHASTGMSPDKAIGLSGTHTDTTKKLKKYLSSPEGKQVQRELLKKNPTPSGYDDGVWGASLVGAAAEREWAESKAKDTKFMGGASGVTKDWVDEATHNTTREMAKKHYDYLKHRAEMSDGNGYPTDRPAREHWEAFSTEKKTKKTADVSSKVKAGTRVVVNGFPGARILYGRNPLPPDGTLGTVTPMNVGGGMKTFIPGAGGLLFVKFDNGDFMGVQLQDVDLAPQGKTARVQELMPKSISSRIPKLYSQDDVKDPVVWVKFFNAYGQGTWLITEYDGHDRMFGLADMGYPELGYISLKELQSMERAPGVQQIERDIRFRPVPLSQAVKEEHINYHMAADSERREKMANRPIWQIAKEIKADWKNVNYAAKPYLEAMGDLTDITDNYYQDSAVSVIAYFLSNATSWKGDKAKEIKAELKALSKGKKGSDAALTELVKMASDFEDGNPTSDSQAMVSTMQSSFEKIHGFFWGLYWMEPEEDGPDSNQYKDIEKAYKILVGILKDPMLKDLVKHYLKTYDHLGGAYARANLPPTGVVIVQKTMVDLNPLKAAGWGPTGNMMGRIVWKHPDADTTIMTSQAERSVTLSPVSARIIKQPTETLEFSRFASDPMAALERMAEVRDESTSDLDRMLADYNEEGTDTRGDDRHPELDEGSLFPGIEERLASKVPTGWVVLKSQGMGDIVLTKRPLSKDKAEAMADKYNGGSGIPGAQYHIVEVGPNARYELIDGRGMGGNGLFVRPRTASSNPMAALERLAGLAPSDDKFSRFEEGKSADPTKNMSPEDKAEWNKQKDEHKDEFKTAKESYPWDDCIKDQMAEYHDKDTAEKVCGKIKSQPQGKKASNEEETLARFEEGESADPTKNMSPEDKAEWDKQKDEHKDEFKKEGASNIVWVSIKTNTFDDIPRPGTTIKLPWENRDGDLINCCPYFAVVKKVEYSPKITRMQEQKGFLQEVILTVEYPGRELKDLNQWYKDIMAYLDGPKVKAVTVLTRHSDPAIWDAKHPKDQIWVDELPEMKKMLQDHGYNPGDAENLLISGMMSTDLKMRLLEGTLENYHLYPIKKLATDKAAYTSYSGDPKWMKAKFPGRAKDGTIFQKGDEILYWPRTRDVMVGKAAEQAWREFESQAQDEDVYNQGHYASIEKQAGYTHYWRMARDFTSEEWSEIRVQTLGIISDAQRAKIVLAGSMGTGKPKVTPTMIAINGSSELGEDYEPFVLTRKKDDGFCKTAQRPYDAVVVSILSAAQDIAPDAIKVKSDGGPSAIKRVFASTEKEALTLPALHLTPIQKAENWLRDVFSASAGVVAKDDLIRIIRVNARVYGKELITKALKALVSESYIKMEGSDYVWLDMARMASDLESEWNGHVAFKTPTGLYGVSRRVQSDCESATKRLAKHASILARRIYAKDERVAEFMSTHAERGSSLSARVLMAAMSEIGPKFEKQAGLEGHHHSEGGKWYVDSNFMSLVQSVYPGAKLEHMGMGEFTLETPDGNLEFDRMRGENFDGQVGHSHQLHDNAHGKVVEKAIKLMDQHNKSVKVAETTLSPEDKKVIDAFIDKKKAESKKYSTDGKTLDGLWSGGTNIAEWGGGSIAMIDRGSKAVETVQNYIRKNAPRKSVLASGRIYGLYGYPSKTAKLGVTACADLREQAGIIASDMHRRQASNHEHITRFLGRHASEGNCVYSKMLHESYPDASMKMASSRRASENWLEWEK